MGICRRSDGGVLVVVFGTGSGDLLFQVVVRTRHDVAAAGHRNCVIDVLPSRSFDLVLLKLGAVAQTSQIPKLSVALKFFAAHDVAQIKDVPYEDIKKVWCFGELTRTL